MAREEPWSWRDGTVGKWLSWKVSVSIVYICKTNESCSVSRPVPVELGWLKGNQTSPQELLVST